MLEVQFPTLECSHLLILILIKSDIVFLKIQNIDWNILVSFPIKTTAVASFLIP